MVNFINLFKFEKQLGGERNDTLQNRKIKFLAMLSQCRRGLKTEQLPLIQEVAVQHAIRMYLQMTYWKALMNTETYHRLWDLNCWNQL